MSFVRLVSLVILAVSPLLLAAPIPNDGLGLGKEVGQTISSVLPVNNPTSIGDDIPKPNIGDPLGKSILRQRWNDESTVSEDPINFIYDIANRDSIDPESHIQNDATPAQESTSVVNVPYEADGNGDHDKVLKGDSVNSKRLTMPASVSGVEQQLSPTINHVSGDVSELPVEIPRDSISPLDHAPIVDKNVFNHYHATRETIDPELPVHNNVAAPMDSESAPSAASLPYEDNGNGDHDKVLDDDSVNAKKPQDMHDGSDLSHPGPEFVDATQTPP